MEPQEISYTNQEDSRNGTKILETNMVNEVANMGVRKSAAQVLNRSKRVPGLILTFGKVLFKALGVLFGVGSYLNSNKAGKEAEKNFEKIFAAVDRNYDAINRNYLAINNVELKVDRNFVVLRLVYEMVNETLSAVEKTRVEMHQGFSRVLESIKDLEIKPTLSKIKSSVQYFSNEKEIIKNLPRNEYIMKLEEQNSILVQLRDYRTPKSDSLHVLLHDIINQNHAIPQDANDEVRFTALYALYYGTQTYVSVMFFLLEQYSYLADYHYQNGDVEKYNDYLDSVVTSFRDFRYSLVGSDESLIDSVVGILREVRKKEFIKKRGENSYRILSERIESLTLIKHIIEEMKLPVIVDEPVKLTGRPDFSEPVINTPVGEWIAGAKVRYAVQYRNNDTYSKVGEWSDPLTVSGRANPFLKIPVDRERRTRLIFRKFNSDKPQLVGVIENKYETRFRDINRDLYNAASRFNRHIAMSEVEVLLRSGADVNAVFDKGRRAVHAAAQRDNTRLARDFFIKSNATDINVKDSDGYTPMHIAAEAGHDEFIKLLIEYGADANAKTDSEELTPLHIASYKGYESTVKTLMQSNATDLNAKDKEGFTPLHSAVFGGVPVLRALMSNSGTDVNAKSKEGLTPIHLSSINNYLDVTETLLESYNVDINSRAGGNMTTLHFASMLGDPEIVKFLIAQKEIDVNAESVNRWTSLHFAISLEKEDVVSELLNVNSTDVNVAAEGNVTPLHTAAATGEEGVVLGLLAKGAQINEETKDGLTALHIAAMHGSQKVMSSLIDKGANIEARTINGLTPLQSAASSQNSNVNGIKYLVERGADLNAASNSGETFLHLAAKSGNSDIVKYFIGKYDVNARDCYGNSPLHFAAESGHLGIVEYLIQKGASIRVKNYRDKTLLHFAASSGNLDLVRYFVEKAFDVNAKDKDGDTPLYTAAKNSYLDIVKYLVEETDADINAKNNGGKTVLHFAAFSGNLNLVKYLVENWIDLNAKDDNGLAPLLFAAKNGHLDIVKYFIEENDVDLNVVCNFASRPVAAYYNHSDVFKYLVYKENSNIAVINNYVSLLSGVQNGHLDIVTYLAEERYDFNPDDVSSLLILYAPTIIKLHSINETVNDLSNVAKLYFTTYGIISRGKEFTDYLILLSAASGHLSIVKYFIDEKSTDVNAKYDKGMTVLHYAASNGHLDVVRYLTCEKQADFSAEDDDGMTPLLFAAKSDHLDVVKFLVGRGANLNSSNNRAPLLLAAANGSLDMIKYLMERGADVNATSRGGLVTDPMTLLTLTENDGDKNSYYYDSTSLCNAARNGHLSVVRYFVEKGADVNAKNENDHTPLQYAAEKGSLDMVRYLTEKGADVNAKNKNDHTPLHYAAENGFLDIVKYLTEKGADVNAKNKNYHTSLYCAAKYGYLDIVKYLAEEKGGNFNTRSNNFSALLDYAIKGGHSGMVRYLLERGASLSTDTLHNAAASGNLDTVKYLVQKGVSIHGTTSRYFTHGLTPLHYAAEMGHLDIVKYLADEKHANVNVKDSYDWTPLHYAARGGHLDVVKYLIGEKHATPNVKGSDGNTPLICAMSNNHPSVGIYIVEKCGYHICDRDNVNKCLSGAIVSGHLSIVKYAVEHGADINLRYSREFIGPQITPLQDAVINGHFDIVKYLIEKGADINAKISQGLFTLNDRTSLHIAAENGRLDIVEYLTEKGADIGAKANGALTPFHVANLRCNSAVANFLKSKDVSRNRRNVEFEDLPKEGKTSRYNYNDDSPEVKDNQVASASKPSSWVKNVFANTIVDAVKGVSQFLLSPFRPAIDMKHSHPSKAITTQAVDANSTLFLLNVFVRKITGQEFIFTADQSMPELEARVYALNITTKFEKILKDTAKKSGVSVDLSSVNSFEVSKAITGKIMSGESSKIPTILFSAGSEAYPENKEFLDILKGNIEKMLDEQQKDYRGYSNNKVQGRASANDKTTLPSLESIAAKPANNRSLRGVTSVGRI